MDKIWYILIDGQQEGPFSLAELKQDSRITPDTLVWKQGFKEWIPIRHIPDLKSIFEDETQDNEEEKEPEIKKVPKKKLQDNEVIALRSDPPFSYLWLLIILILILLYALFQLYK